jgi:hypothetical protein
MMRHMTATLLMASLLGGAGLVGCDRTVDEKTTETTHSDGSKTTDSTKTTVGPDGTRRTTSEHSSNNTNP